MTELFLCFYLVFRDQFGLIIRVPRAALIITFIFEKAFKEKKKKKEKRKKKFNKKFESVSSPFRHFCFGFLNLFERVRWIFFFFLIF